METDLLMNRYSALRHELSVAYQELPWQGSRIDQIADDLAETERALTAVHGRVPSTFGAAGESRAA